MKMNLIIKAKNSLLKNINKQEDRIKLIRKRMKNPSNKKRQEETVDESIETTSFIVAAKARSNIPDSSNNNINNNNILRRTSTRSLTLFARLLVLTFCITLIYSHYGSEQTIRVMADLSKKIDTIFEFLLQHSPTSSFGKLNFNNLNNSHNNNTSSNLQKFLNLDNETIRLATTNIFRQPESPLTNNSWWNLFSDLLPIHFPPKHVPSNSHANNPKHK